MTGCVCDVGGPFSLDAVSSSEYKLLTTAVLDRELTDRYLLTLTCTDLGSAPLTSTTHVDVFVLDDNDLDPVFTDRSKVRVVRQVEGDLVGRVITKVKATDQDAGVNSVLSYSMRPLDSTPDNVLEMMSDSGDVVVKAQVDYETHQQYRYT